ncbi:MAG TPA: 50S ribosomal protein P1 [Euryarchaeota archaeon]|nr:MAG: 50S ribosomal protein P1 [Thermoplasmatales archaeon ex4484_6]RLF69541.1 MAG: 50S ribosomal protein P1 [Thermoplasmata archaeon]HHD15481.1 50S ribosomal protein P1 [Euryarchaeota archaeon]
MEYIYGALLLHSAGKPINEGDLTKVLEAAGVSVEAARVKAVVTSLEGVDIEEAMKTAAVAAAPAAAAPAAASGEAAPAEEKKKEEKKAEEEEAPSEEEAMAGLGALFG